MRRVLQTIASSSDIPTLKCCYYLDHDYPGSSYSWYNNVCDRYVLVLNGGYWEPRADCRFVYLANQYARLTSWAAMHEFAGVFETEAEVDAMIDYVVAEIERIDSTRWAMFESS